MKLLYFLISFVVIYFFVDARPGSVLSLNELTEFSDCVLPVENQALIDIVKLTTQSTGGGKKGNPTGPVTAEALVNRDGPARAPAVVGSVLTTHDKAVRQARRQQAPANNTSSAAASADGLFSASASAAGEAKATSGVGDGSKPFDQMNTIAAHVLTNLTCSMRFEGSLSTRDIDAPLH